VFGLHLKANALCNERKCKHYGLLEQALQFLRSETERRQIWQPPRAAKDPATPLVRYSQSCYYSTPRLHLETDLGEIPARFIMVLAAGILLSSKRFKNTAMRHQSRRVRVMHPRRRDLCELIITSLRFFTRLSSTLASRRQQVGYTSYIDFSRSFQSVPS